MVEMSRKLAEYLKNSQTLDDYCQQEFGKGITVAVEYANTNEVPDINSVPYLMVYNAGKVEGLAKQAEYSCDLVVGVSSEAAGEDNYVVTDSEVYILRSYKLASDIIQIIQQELNNYKDKKLPPKVFQVVFTGEVDQAGRLWTALIHLEWEFEQILGPIGMTDF